MLLREYTVYRIVRVAGAMAKRAGEAGVEVDIRHGGRRSYSFDDENSSDRAMPERHNSPSLSGCKATIADLLGLTAKLVPRERGEAQMPLREGLFYSNLCIYKAVARASLGFDDRLLRMYICRLIKSQFYNSNSPFSPFLSISCRPLFLSTSYDGTA